MDWRTLEEREPKCHAQEIDVVETSSATLE